MYEFVRKKNTKKPKHFVRYFYSSALPVQLNMYNVTVSLSFGGYVRLHGLDRYSSFYHF